MIVNSFISYWDNYFTEQECRYFISKFDSAPRSRIDFKKLNSSTYPERFVIRSNEDAALRYIFSGINEVVNNDISNFEKVIQIFKYYDGDFIGPHYDNIKYNTQNYTQILQDFGDRVQTFMIFLNTPQNGGGWRFQNIDVDIEAVQGKFLHYKTKDELDVLITDSIHQSMPVTVGPMYVLVGHIRSKKQPI